MSSVLRPVVRSRGGRPTIKLGLIGCGWYGMVDVKAAFKAGGVEVIGPLRRGQPAPGRQPPRKSRNSRARGRRLFKRYAGTPRDPRISTP